MEEARIEQAAPEVVAFIGMHGPFAQIPRAFGTLYGWLAARGLAPAGMPRAVYVSDPRMTPESEAVWELQAPVGGDAEDVAQDETGCGVKHLGARTEARLLHRGPYECLRETYEALERWIGEQGYVPSGPSMEVYLSDPNDTAPEDTLTEVRFPVRAE